MNKTHGIQINPDLDLVLERVVDVPKESVWKAWTTPDQILKWFTPAPWRTTACEIDLRPGGRFYTVMEGPNGERFENTGSFLEVIENEKLVWTSALLPDFRPAPSVEGGFHFSAVIYFEDHEGGTKYTAIAIHPDEATRVQHEGMGFHTGWGKALDQLVEMVKSS